MDVIFFLKDRIDFIRQLYRVTSAPYFERIRQIEDKEEPYTPIYSDYNCFGEPLFQKEYNEASKSLNTLRMIYFSMLSSALHSYLKTWIKLSRTQLNTSGKKIGWFGRYKEHFLQHFDIDFEKSIIDLKVIEEVILTRNDIEHESSIASPPKYSVTDYDKIQNLTYIEDFSRCLLQEIGYASLTAPSINITEEQFFSLASSIESFAVWLKNEIEPKIYPLRSNQHQNN